MRKHWIFFYTIICCIHVFGQTTPTTDTDNVEKRINNNAVMVGMAVNMVINQQPIFDVRAYADTLYNDLYKNPTEITIGVKYAGKIILQAFFALSEDSRIDYPDIERCLAVTGKHEVFYTLPFIVCAYYYSQWAEQQQLTNKEIAALQLGLKAHDKIYPDSTTFFSQVMNLSLSNIYYQQKEWSSAAKYTERLLTDFRRLGQEGTDEFFDFLSALASCYQFSGKISRADSCLQLVQQHLEQARQKTTDNYVELLINRADLQESLGKYDESEALLLKAQKGLKVTDEYYHDIMLQLAQNYTDCEKYENALSILQQELGFFEKKPHTPSMNIFPWIVFCDNPLSTNEGHRFVALLEKMQDGSIENMAVLAYAYCHAHQYDKAQQTTKKMEQAYEKLSVEEKENLLVYLQPLYTNLNDFDRQIELSKMQVASVEMVVGKSHDLYAKTVALLASIYSMKGDYSQSLQLLDSCTNIPNINSSTLIEVYDHFSDIYSTMGDFSKSNHYASVLLKHTDDVSMKRKLMGRIVVNLISELEIREYDIDEQGKADTDSLQQLLIDYATQSLDYCRQYFGEGHLNTIEAMEYLAAAYYLSGDTSRLLEMTQDCEKSINDNIKNPSTRKLYLQMLAPYYRKCKNYTKALELVDTTCLQMPKAMYTEIKATLEALAELNLDMGQHEQAQKYYERLAKAITNETSNQMGLLTSQARQYYWRMSRHTLSDAGKYLQQMGVQNPFAGVIYNLALFTKNLLLTSEQAFVRAVRETNDETLIEKMRLMLNLRTALVQNTIMSADEIASKTKYVEQLEQELLTVCQKNNKNSIYNESTDWHEVQQALNDTAIAIEMVQYTQPDESAYYGAVLLRKEWSAPVFIQLGKKTQFESINAQDLSIENGNMIWHHVMPYLNNIRTIYFSPVGVFHSIPIEDMPCDNYENMSKSFHVYRLSSTSHILSLYNNVGKDAVIYGGLEFAMSVNEMEQDAKRQRGAGDVTELKYLEGTAIEANSIATLINGIHKDGMSAQLYTGKEGTEASFKALSNQRKRVMHIGTHGFYAPDDNEVDASTLARNLNLRVNTEDKALLKSWLCMAGADNKLNKESIPDGVDDGLLTAQEVSTLDLRGLELVTLSACQTAQGHITNDGVFGLQRGFKKAGAQSILMSLWKVDDEATCLLMTEFYKNWIKEGKTKHDALEMAKQTVRSQEEKGWNKPKYWAAFILLDGLD